MESITITISKDVFSFLVDNDLLGEFTVKEVIVKDNLFKGDEHHKTLLKAMLKAKDQLKEYEFKKRHNVT